MGKREKNKCCVSGCEDTNSPRHRFPKDPEVYKIWLKNVNNPNVYKQTPEVIRRNKFYVVCDRHFLDKYKRQGPYKKLTNNAVPTLHLPNGDLEEPMRVIEKNQPNFCTGKLKEFMENLNRFIGEPPITTICKPQASTFNRQTTPTIELQPTPLLELQSTPIIEPQTTSTEYCNIPSNLVYEILEDDVNNHTPNKTPEITTEPFESVESIKEDTTITELLPLFTKTEVSYKIEKVKNSDLDNLNSLFELVPVTTEIIVNYDPTNICRLCLTRTTKLVSIFNTNTIDTKEILYSEMITECASVQIEENDKLPKGICSECIEKLNLSYKFRKLCEKSDQNLNRFLNKYEDNSDETSNISNVEEIVENADHIEIVQDETVLETPELILESSENEVDLKNQQLVVEQKKPITYLCKICNINFSRFRLLNTHLKNTHKNLKSYTCGKCLKKFNCIEKLNQHVKNHTRPKRFHCTICTKSFHDKCRLLAHFRVHTGEKNFTCNICNKRFGQKSYLNYHLKRHSESEIYLCTVCGKNLRGPKLLKIHMLKHTRDRNYVCQICGKIFTTLYSVKVHERIHRGEKPFSCTECGKAFVARNGLQTHLRTHSDERPYLCSDCGLNFKTGTLLKNHSVVHLTEKPHVCHLCSKRFSRIMSLRMHLKIHAGKFDHFCSYCNKGFIQPKKLKIHVMQLHTGERPFSCDICGKGFVRADNYRNHLKTH